MTTFSLRFFGPGLIVDQLGQPVAVRSRKQLGLLAYLASEYQIAHSRETLLALFWPDEATPTALNNLRVTLSRLRELGDKLAPTGATNVALLATDRHSVQLEPAWIEHADTNRFNQLLESTRQHEHASRSQCAHCQTALQQAVQHYQGDFLEGFGLNECAAFEEWLFMQRERLRLLVIEGYADLASFAESSGDLAAARSFSQRQTELDPLRESAYRQQMRILSKQGERSAALATFARCRAILSTELGLDPEPETLALHWQILQGELAPQPSATLPPAMPSATRAPATPRHNLPQQLTPFIGREDEIAQLQARLAEPTYRLLSIVGPGGIGKSRLAQQLVAQQVDHFRDGVYFVALAQLQQHDSMPAAIAETLELSFSASSKSPTEQLIEMIRDKQLLLVLDNFEHLMDGTGLLVQLLQQATKLVLIVTSRERLDIQAEDLFELHGLATPASPIDSSASSYAAVRLFVDRAHRLDKAFKLTSEQLPHVVRICQLVEGFPLAIELAATWLRDLTCQEIVAELSEGLAGLETTLRDIQPAHRSLRTVFNASWRLLNEAERRTLAKLSALRGGFNLDAAHAIANASPVLLSALRNKSLLRHAGARRYDMHALVQQFSAEALATDVRSAAQVRNAHSHYFLTLLAEQTVALDTREAGAASAKIQADWENVMLGWQWATEQGQTELLQNALDSLVRFCDLRGLYQESQALVEAAVARLESLLKAEQLTGGQLTGEPDETQQLTFYCRLLTALINIAECRDDYARTLELAQQALPLAHRLDNLALIIDIYLNQAKSFEIIGDNSQGLALAEKTLQLAQAAKLELQAGASLELIGYNAYQLGDYARSSIMYQRLLAFHEQTGRLELAARLAISILGSMAREQGDYEVGLNYCQRFLASSTAIDDRINIAQAYHYLARAWLQLGNFAQAIALATQGAARASTLGYWRMCSAALCVKAAAHRQLGQQAEALACADEALSLAQQAMLADALLEQAEAQMALAQTENDWAQAAATFRAAVARLRAMGKELWVYEAEIGLAELARRRGQTNTALRLIQPLLPHLPTINVAGWGEPIRAYVVCLQILHAVHDPAAETLLVQGLRLLDHLAQKISDRTLRQTFLQAIPAHCTLQTWRVEKNAP